MKPIRTNQVTTPQIEVKASIAALCRVCKNPFNANRIKCYDRELLETTCKTCLLDQDENEKRWMLTCPLEFRTTEEGGNTRLERMDMDSPQWRKILDWRFNHKGLLVRGETGRCKTRAVWRLLRAQFDKRRTMKVMTAGQFDRSCRDAGGNFTITNWFNRLANVDILFIDDLGKASWSQQTEAQFFDLIDERTREGRPVFVTTNDSGESLAARMSDDRAEPLIRRLRDYCTTITL